jgi:uncharacterized membrane protein
MIPDFFIKSRKAKKVFGFTGSAFWLLIIPIKLNRFFNLEIPGLLNNNLPSFLGAAGLFFMLLSAKGKLSNLSVAQSAFIAISVSVLVEVIQLIPRPGILSYINYTFDFLDILFSLIGVGISYLIILFIYSGKNLRN